MNHTFGIIDDQKMFSEGLSLLIAKNPDYKVILEACSMEDALTQMAGLKTHPDIIFIAIHIPGHNGAEIAASIHKKYPLINLVAISYFHKPVKIAEMMESGCVAFFGKNIEHGLLYSGIHDIIKGCFHNTSECFMDKKSFYQSRLYQRVLEINLLDSEKVYLLLLCSGMTYKKIGLKMNIKNDSVDYYRKHIYKKFDVSNKADLIFICQKLGYID